MRRCPCEHRLSAKIGFVDTYPFAIAKDYANQAAASIEAQATA
jgi:hypothetical protein